MWAKGTRVKGNTQQGWISGPKVRREAIIFRRGPTYDGKGVCK